MMNLISRLELESMINLDELLPALIESQKQAFIAYSTNSVSMPPPMQLDFIDEHGDCHIKSAYATEGDIFVIKCATGFYLNTRKNLPPGDGLFLIICQKTGMIKKIIHDQGLLTTLRTALAGIIAMNLTPWQLKSIGIIGSGQVAQMLLKILNSMNFKHSCCLWTRRETEAFKIHNTYPEVIIKKSIDDLSQCSDVIFTTTASSTSLLKKFSRSKQHFIGIGADSLNKNEIDSSLFYESTQILVDSLKQAFQYGDSANALKKYDLSENKFTEFGTALSKPIHQDHNFIISDLTGIAAQDLYLAMALELNGSLNNSEID